MFTLLFERMKVQLANKPSGARSKSLFQVLTREEYGKISPLNILRFFAAQSIVLLGAGAGTETSTFDDTGLNSLMMLDRRIAIIGMCVAISLNVF